jgi:predicted small lipoprotein YifL
VTRRGAAALGVLACVLGGCGLKGPLYLPEKTGDVVVRPAPAATPPATPAEPVTAPPATPAPPPPQAAPPTGPGARG